MGTPLHAPMKSNETKPVDVAQFLTDLFQTGRVEVHEPAPNAIDERDSSVRDVIVAFEAEYRLSLPGEPPTLRVEAAEWAADQFYFASQFTVFRNAGPDAIAERLEVEPSAGIDLGQADRAAVAYSVDLVFRFLTNLMDFAKSASMDDPLVSHLLEWAKRWPLSSVGIADVGDVAIDEFAQSPSLMQLYADRIIATKHAARLANPAAREIVAASLGLHAQLSPQIHDALKRFDESETTA